MNWEAVGAVGEILGAFAVVATLIYLASQVKHAKEAAADINRIARATGVREFNLAMAANDDLRNSVNKVMGGDKYIAEMAAHLGVSEADMSRTESANVHWFWLHWGQYASTTNEGDLAELRNLIAGFYSNAGVRVSWEQSPYARPILDPDFVSFVDQILAEQNEEKLS